MIETIIANQVADKAKNELYGLHGYCDSAWNLLFLKMMVLDAIEYSETNGYFTDEQIDCMKAKIGNINLVTFN